MDDEDFDTHILAEAETILISPGIKQSHLVYTNYASKIKSELNFLGSLLPSIGFATMPSWIGVTATNGKSTTTWIGYLLLKQLFPNRHVWIT
jgi:UDP-N-acetylmuramoylalanine-D-glutamate ligase